MRPFYLYAAYRILLANQIYSTSVWRADEGRTAKQKSWKQKSGILSQQFSFLICRLEMSTPKSYKYGPETKRLHTQKKGKSHVLSSIVGFITNGLKKLKN